MRCIGGPVAGRERAPVYEPGCRRFDSSQARHFLKTKALRIFRRARLGCVYCTVIAHWLDRPLLLRGLWEKKSRQKAPGCVQSIGLDPGGILPRSPKLLSAWINRLAPIRNSSFRLRDLCVPRARKEKMLSSAQLLD